MVTEQTYCEKHPDVETRLHCSQCGKAVCPKCMVHAPVGIRCEECGKSKPLPVYDVGTSFLARAIGAAAAVGLVGGLALAIIIRPLFGGFGLIYVVALAGFGYVMAEAICWATNHKRGRTLQYVAAGGLVLAYLAIVYYSPNLNLFDLLGGGIGIYIAFTRLR